MTATDTSSPCLTRPGLRLLVLAGLFLVEVVALAILYQFFTSLECHQTGIYGLCRFLRSLVARALVIFAVFGLLAWARPGLLAPVLANSATMHRSRIWPALHFAGVALLALPMLIAPAGDLGAIFGGAVWFLLAGSVAAGLGGLLWLAPAADWRRLLLQDRATVPLILMAAGLLPDLADLALPLWDWQALTSLTFRAVVAVLHLFSDMVVVDAPGYVIGVENFRVHIARQCSGIEGVALMTGFVALYAFIFRETVRPGRLWLTVLPVAILLSWGLNVLRIALLILLGARASPELAVNGFHSYAGWLFFTLLALTLMVVVQATPWLHRAPLPPGSVSLRTDPLAGQLLPFAGFLLASLLTHALYPHPELGYPLRVIVLAILLWLFRAAWLRLEWRADPLALGTGVLVGAGWLWLDGAPGEDGVALAQALGGLSGLGLAIWIASRMIGTVLLVPLVEELFFRGYLLTRLNGPQPWRSAAAILISSVLFGLLHGRWLEASVAGALFGLLRLRSGRLSDAIVAHGVANLLVAFFAFATSDFSRI